MAVSYQIFPEQGFVYVRYEGIVRASESIPLSHHYLADPDFCPRQKRLIDTADVTELVHDYVGILELQALLAEVLLGGESDMLVAFYAPNPIGQTMAEIEIKSWQGVPGVAVRVFDTLQGAEAFLGIDDRSLHKARESVG